MEQAHAPIPDPVFRALWGLAAAHGHHWAGAIQGDAPGVPSPPCGLDAWTPALVEALAAATVGPLGGICTIPLRRGHVTTTGRLRWEIDGEEIRLVVARPHPEGDTMRNGVIIVGVHLGTLAPDVRMPVGIYDGHPGVLGDAPPLGRHVQVALWAMRDVGVEDPRGALLAAAGRWSEPRGEHEWSDARIHYAARLRAAIAEYDAEVERAAAQEPDADAP